jgi:hypothetical protein
MAPPARREKCTVGLKLPKPPTPKPKARMSEDASDAVAGTLRDLQPSVVQVNARGDGQNDDQRW